jgi:ATP-dependent helicase/nuclease subunit B
MRQQLFRTPLSHLPINHKTIMPIKNLFLDRVARHILDQHLPDLPDLRRCTVLLPNNHVAAHLAEALANVSGNSGLLLPKMVTLSDWAESIPLDEPVIPDTCRASVLYQALHERGWFASANLWSISSELLKLLDDMTRHHVTLPLDESEFLAQLELAYQAKANESMQFEARVVHELWYAMSASGELDAARAHQQRLAQIAEQAEAPLVVLLTSTPATQEARFLEAYAAKAPVTIFDLREMVADEDGCAAIRTLPSRKEGANSHLSLREQADSLRDRYPQGNMGQRLRLFGANGLEQEASAAELQIHRWLLDGKQNIAIVANDRIVARRVCALLGRAGVNVRDESGWLFSTLSVSTVMMRWLDALQSNFHYQDMLDLLKSPFIFADQSSMESKQAVFQLEKLVRKYGVTSNLDAFLDLARSEPEVQTVLARLRQASEVMRHSSDTLSGWLKSLNESLVILGVISALEADAAGAQLLQLLQGWQTELASNETRLKRSEWRRWLAQQFDSYSFIDYGKDSAVVLTNLASTRWRSFDAVVMLGCDARHLPNVDCSESVWFNDAVRGTLELPTRADHMEVQRDNLLALLSMNDTVLATWQSTKQGEINMLSPYLEMLRAVHKLAYGDDLTHPELKSMLEEVKKHGAALTTARTSGLPAPFAPISLVPKRISANGYNSLVACPYQFFARYMLRLNEMDEVKDGVEKRDYGQWVHAALHRFHEQFPVLGAHPRAVLEDALNQISGEVFAPTMKHDYLASAWLLRWQQAIPAYLDSQIRSEGDGWTYKSGEVAFEMPLTEDLTMHGRIDRLDQHANGMVRVLDYKMIEAGRLRGRLKEAGEDVQLPCYASVYEANEAAYVSIDKDKVSAVAPPQDMGDLRYANTKRLLDVFDQMRKGAALPANGVEDACVYCEVRGLCRKIQ